MVKTATPFAALNAFGAGGLSSDQVYNVFGDTANKTRLFVANLVASALLPIDMGGSGGQVCYINCSPNADQQHLVRQIASVLRHWLSAQTTAVLDKHLNMQSADFTENVDVLLSQLEQVITRPGDRYAMLVIDDLGAIMRRWKECAQPSTQFSQSRFKANYHGNYANRADLLAELLQRLHEMAQRYKLQVVFCTGQYVALQKSMIPENAHLADQVVTHLYAEFLADKRVRQLHITKDSETPCIYRLTRKSATKLIDFQPPAACPFVRFRLDLNVIHRVLKEQPLTAPQDSKSDSRSQCIL